MAKHFASRGNSLFDWPMSEAYGGEGPPGCPPTRVPPNERGRVLERLRGQKPRLVLAALQPGRPAPQCFCNTDRREPAVPSKTLKATRRVTYGCHVVLEQISLPQACQAHSFQGQVARSCRGVEGGLQLADSTGQVTVNFYGGTGGASYEGWGWLHQSTDDSGWRVGAVADMDGNGTPDLIWQQIASPYAVTVNYYNPA